MSPKWRKLESAAKIKKIRWPAAISSARRQRLKSVAGNRGVMALLIFANLLVGFGYLIQTNLTASAGYEIQTWEKKVTKLEEENRNLNLDYIELQSMDKLISGAQDLSLVPVKNVETIAAETVALNR